jgi:MFS family permease
MSALDSRSVNVALPTLSVYFDASLAVVQWIPLAYQLTIVGLVLSMARLGDKLGRKKIYTMGFILLGLGSAFQSPNLSGMFAAVAPRYVGSVSGLSLTSVNIVNAMGVAVGSVLFLRWLNYHGLRDAMVPPYTEWGKALE